MQSIFRLPWCSEQLKMSDRPVLDTKMRSTPVVDIPMLNTLKRKLSDGPDVSPQAVHPAKRQQSQQRSEAEYPHQLLTPCSPVVYDARIFSKPDSQPSSQQLTYTDNQIATTDVQTDKPRVDSGTGEYFTSKPVQHEASDLPASGTMPDPLSGLTPLQQVIENEFNMQILMKHNELRLIEQELAKCQIALEQLRRCELRPYPGSNGLDHSISEGTGPAIIPPSGHSRPSHAPPYGVTDGPYARHYRQWLLHDSLFDSMSPQAIEHAEHLANSGRSTRNAGLARKPATKSLSTTRVVDPLQSIPNYPAPAVKDKNAPLVLRRSTDNKLVKLICNHCKRFNFSSIQGFLNHCRIAHKNDYKSHDAAAIDCGQPLDEQELANLPAETPTVGAPKPAPSRTQSVALAPNKNCLKLVHPLNTSPAPPVCTPRHRPSLSTPAATPMPDLQILTPQSQQKSKFNPAADMPRLSAHFAKHKLGGDLAQAVANAQQKIDLGMDEDAMSPDTPDAGSPLVGFTGGKRMHLAGAGAMRPGTQDGNALQRPESRKGSRQPAQRPRPPPLAAAPLRDYRFGMTQSTLSSPREIGSAVLSPNVADSNPGLVSDHEDDDHGSGSDEETSQMEVAAPRHPLPPAGRSCEDHMELDVQEDDEIDQHGVIIRRNSMSVEEARGLRTTGSPSRKVGGK